MQETLYYEISSEIRTVKKSGRVFESFFSAGECDLLIQYFKTDTGKLLYNGDNIRLDSIIRDHNTDTLHFSMITFFDYMTSNVLLSNKEKIRAYLNETGRIELLMKLNELIERCDKLHDIEAITGAGYLANLAAVSVLIQDIDGRYGIVKRGDSTILGAGYLGVSATGCMEDIDFEKEDPILGCAIRETAEELNIRLDPRNITIRGIAFGRDKLQPVILCDARVPERWEELKQQVPKGTDFETEVKNVYAIPSSELPIVPDAGNMSEAAKMHISLHSDHKE